MVGPVRGAALVEAYHAGEKSLAPFYPAAPGDVAAYRAKLEETRRRLGPEHRRRMAEAIRPTSAAAAEKLARVVAGEGAFVTTGQQPGLFSGPLYNVHKILTLVRLAGALESELGVPVAPLFWVGSDDHDWAEVNHVVVLDVDNTPHRITVEQAADTPPVSMAHRRLGPEIEAAVGRLAELLPETEFSATVLERVRSAYRPGATMAAAYADLLAGLFEPFDLLIVDPAHPVLKALAAPVFRAELEASDAHERIVAAQTERLVAAGYHAQVGIGGATNVSYEDEEGRERLVREDGRFLLRRTKRSFSQEELLALLESEPERFSPNVVLRPVVESALFPTIGYVAGPGELSYFAQLGCFFQAHGIAMPTIYPRAGVTLVERKVRKVLEKFSLSIEDFATPVHELAARVVRDELPDDVRESIGALRTAIDQGYTHLADTARSIDATLKGPITGARNASHVALRDAEKKILGHLKEQNATSLDQIAKAAANLRPEGAPQERVLNATQYLARYGPELLPAIAAAIEIRLGEAPEGWRGLDCSGEGLPPA